MWFTLRYLCLATAVLCIERPILQDAEELKNRYHFRRAVDGSRGSKYFDPDEDGSYDHYRHLEDHYDGSKVESGFDDIRGNVPGEPGADYPVFTEVPKTRFSCENRAQGYYADQEAGCQAFHVCSNVVVSSFICPVGSIFSQKLLTCDWWNKVNCATTESYYTMQQESFKDTNEMVQKAFTMMQPPEPPQIEAKFDARRTFGTSRDENVRKYNHFSTKDTGVFENSGFGRDGAGVNRNAQPAQNVINVNLRPKGYEGNFEGFGSRLNNQAKDSPIVFVQKYPNDNVQESSTLRPFALGNILQGSYQFNENGFRNSHQPSSYAPTVPTVTTTTRRLYTPTVPTTYRPSTISHDEYDQDSLEYSLQVKPNQQSSQVYETASYDGQYQGNFAETIQPEESIGIVQSYGEKLIKSGNNDVARSASNRGNTGAQFGARSKTVNSNAPELEEGYRHFYTDQLTVDSRLRRQETEAVGSVPVDSSREAMRLENQMNFDLSNSQRNVPPLIVQIPRPEGEPGKPAIDIGDQLFTYDSFMKTSSVMPETPPPVGSSTQDFVGVSIRMNSADSSTIITPLIPETAPPPVSSSSGATDDENVFPPPRRRPPMIADIPQSIGTLGLNFSGVLDTAPPVSSSSASSAGATGDEDVFPPPRRRPPMISDIPQSIGMSGLDFSGVPNETQTFEPSRTTFSTPETTQRPASTFSLMDDDATTVPPRTTPIISQIPGSVGASGVNISDIPDSTFTFGSFIPPPIIQPSQNETRSASQSPSMAGDESTSDASPGTIPSLTDENGSTAPPRTTSIIFQIPGSVGASGVNISDTTDRNFTLESPLMPPPILQPSVNATPPAPQPSSMVDDSSAFDTPPRIIPPLIPPVPQSTDTPVTSPPDGNDGTNTFESSSRIPLLIPPTPRPLPPSFSGTIDDGDIPTRLPPLIPPVPQSTDTPVTSPPDGNDGKNTFESSSRIPLLIPPTPRPVPPSFSGTIDDGDVPTRLPPLIPPVPQSTDTPVTSPPDGNDGKNTFESSSRIPLLIPPTPRPVPPSFSGTIDDGDVPTRLPPLIPPVPQSTDTPVTSPPDGNDGKNTFESSSRIPLLIPPTPRPVPPSFSGTIDDGDVPTRLPPLIPPVPQSTDTPVTSPPDGNDGKNTFESSSRIPLLIPPTPRPVPPSFSGTIDDGDVPTRLPPLIPPVPQSTDTPVTSPPDGNDGKNTFESSSRIPPLLPPTPRPPLPPRPQFSGTNDDEDIPSRIPPLIPQVPQPTDTPTTDVPDIPDVTYPYELPSNIPPLISQTSRPPAPSDVSLGTTDSGVVPTRIPVLIPQTPKPIDTLAINSPDERYPFELPSNIPPLLPPTPRTPPPSQTESSGTINDDDVPARIPPLIPQIPQPTDTPATDAPDISDRTYPFEFPSAIPPLIPQTSRPSPPSESQSPDTINDGNTPTRIPPLIHQTPDTSDSSYPFESPSSIQPLIPQTMANDEGTSIVPQPVNPLISEPAGTPGANQPEVPVRKHPSEVPSGTPPLIPQDSRFGTPSGTKSPNQIVGEDQYHVPTTLAPVIPQILEHIGRPGVNPSNIYYHTKTSFESNRPSPDLLPPSFLSSIDINSNNRNPSNWVSSTTEQTFFTYTGQYQPLPINIFPTSTTQQPGYSYSFVTSPTVNIPAYHSEVPETATISPTPHVENPGSSGYGIDVPDYGRTTGTSHSTPETIPSTASDDHSSHIGSLESEVERTRVQISGGISQFPIDNSQQSSVTQAYDIALGLLPPKIDNKYPNSIRHDVTRQNLVNEETSTLASLGVDPNHDGYNLYEQSSISPSTDSGKSSPQVSGPEQNDDLRFTIRGAGLRHPIPTPLPAFNGISSTLRPRTESLSPPSQSVFISDNPNTQFVQPQLYYPENVALNRHQDSSTPNTYKDTNLTPQPTESPSGGISYSQGPYTVQYSPSAASATLDTSRDAYLQSIGSGSLPPGFPTGFSQIQESSNNDDSPYQITITYNGGEDFNPTPDLINRLLAQHNADGQLGFDHLAGYEIVRSEDPEDPVENATPTSPVNIAPSQAPTLSTLFDSRVTLGGQQSAQQYYISDHNRDSGIILTTSETRGPEVKPLTSDGSRPSSFFGDGPDAASQNSLNLGSLDLPTKNATQWASELRDEEIRNRANLLKLKAEDVNSSFGTTAKSVVPKKTESTPLVREQILEQLNRNFGQPLFNYGGSQGYSVRSEASRSIDHTDKQQFVDLEKYRVKNKDVVQESKESASPAPPETSTIVTTPTSTTPQPVRTFVKTEFLPALSFSFDSETGRQEYVDAVLKGLLNDNHPVDPWYDFAASNRKSRKSEKSNNETTKMQKA